MKKAGKPEKPKTGTMEERIVEALHKTLNYIASDDTGVDSQGLYELSGDCYLEMYGGDAEACKAFWAMETAEQEKLLKKAFPAYRESK